MTTASIIVPTYNEADNMEPLLTRLHTALDAEWPGPYHIHIVDDNSPDGTATTARDVAAAHDLPVSVHVRPDGSDLSASILYGLRHATGDLCLVMDGDLQHPPEAAPALLAPLTQDADITIGTRRAATGTDDGLSPSRYVVSRCGELLSYLALPSSRGLSDPMSGFFGVRQACLTLDGLTPRGYKLLLELLETHPDATVREVGFTFQERHAGESNLTLAEGRKFLEHLFLARWRRTPFAAYLPAEEALRRVEVGGLLGSAIVLLLAGGLTTVPIGPDTNTTTNR